MYAEFCSICRIFNCVEHEMIAGENVSTRHWRAARQRHELEKASKPVEPCDRSCALKDKGKATPPIEPDVRARVLALGLRHPSKSSCHLDLFEPELTCDLVRRH